MTVGQYDSRAVGPLCKLYNYHVNSPLRTSTCNSLIMFSKSAIGQLCNAFQCSLPLVSHFGLPLVYLYDLCRR